MRETLHFLQTLDLDGNQIRFIAIHCAIQAEDFVLQVASPEVQFSEVDRSEVLAKEHDCPFFVARLPNISSAQYDNHYLQILKNRSMNNIVITGTVIGSSVGGSHNTVQAYITDLARAPAHRNGSSRWP